MCKYCENEYFLLRKDIISKGSWGWGGDISIKESDITEDEYVLFIDRGYLRFVDLDDCQCLEAGKKVKINFCPICGNEIK